MSGKVDKAEALRLRGEGATLQEIGDRFGVTRERVRQIIKTAGRACRVCETPIPADRHGGYVCCGAACAAILAERARLDTCACGSSKSRGASLCRECHLTQVRATRDDELIVALWHRGESVSTIAAALDTTVNALGTRIHRLRGRGLDLPYRRRVFLNGEPTYPEVGIKEMRPKPVSVLGLNTKEQLARGRNADRHRARQRFAAAVAAGTIVRPDTCERCGGDDQRIEGHHPDYSKPLEVEWLCFDCHRSHHIQAGTYSKAAA